MRLGIVLALLFFIIGFMSLPNYGANWDEPNHFGRGQSILHFFLTGEKVYSKEFLGEPAKRSFYVNNGFSFKFFEDKFIGSQPLAVGGHPPLSGILSSLFNKLFYERLGIMGDVEAYHLYSIFVVSIFILTLFYFINDVYGVFPAVVTVISLMTIPMFLGESRFNIKDVPEACYFGLTLISFYYATIKKNQKWLIITAIVFGLGLATKFNILFVLPLLFFWGILAGEKRIVLSLTIISLVGAAIFFISWPMLWADPLGRVAKVLTYYSTIGSTRDFDSRYLTFLRFNTYAFQWILFTTPLVTLFLSLIGILTTLKNRDKASYLVLLWFFVPVARVSVPNANIYGGVRQIMEYIPAMAILTGIGAKHLLHYITHILMRWLRAKQSTVSLVSQILIVLSFIPTTLKIISMYPNESIYFNPLIGGLKGASEKNIPGWGNSLGSTYRQGVKWLNAHAEQHARLATGFTLRSNIALTDLRPDFEFANQFRSGPWQQGEYIIEVTHEGTQEDLYMRKYLDRFLKPVYELTVDGVAILKIWKNDPEHAKEQYTEQSFPKVRDVRKHDNVIDIDIGASVRLTRLIIRFKASSSCLLPEKGYVEESSDGAIWTRAVNSFDYSPVSSWFTTQPYPGILQFLFAADSVRYIRLVVLDNNSCLMNDTIQASVKYL